MFNRKAAAALAVLALMVVGSTITALAVPATVSQYRFLGDRTGWLPRSGEFDVFVQTLRGGQDYKITLSGPAYADFDILVFDENENLVARSTGRTSQEAVYITPRWTGPFYIAVASYSGHGSYTLKIFRWV